MNIFGKRIISLALALLMAFGTAPAAFAIELEEIAGENPVLEERENEIPAEETKQSYEGVSLEYENEELLSAGETEHNHSYAANVTTPTCTERGYTTYICDCGERYVADYVAARGHDYADEKCLHCGSSWPEKLLHFSFDDTIGALKDLTENANKYQSLFDQPFFKALKDLHDTYGAVFSLYCFYNLVDSTDKTTVLFSLEDCTDRYSEEFSQNVGWLRLGFHSVDNLTNYANAKAAEAKIDYDRMIDQILRITGTEKSVDTCVRLQNFAGNLASCQAMRDCEYGVIGLLTSDYAEASSSDVYYTSGYYLKEPATTMIASKGEYYDTSEGLVFYPSNLRLDNISSTAVLAYMDTFLSKEKNDRNKIIIMYAHENQMYKNGQVNSDYIKRLSIVCDWALENEYKFAFPMDRVIKTEELPEENTPNDVNVRTFTNKGYLSVTDGAVTKPESTWVHSELLSLEDITNDSTGICAYKFIGHAYVANIAYYADSDFSTWISSLGSTTGFSGTPTVTAEFVRQNAPEDAKYVAFSTNGESDTLAVSLKAPSTTTNSFDITDKTSAAAYLRSKMIAREPSITIRLNGEVTSSDVSAILAEAWKHTGVPNEGDYIRHNQIGYDYTFTAGEDADGAYTEITYTFNWLTTAEQEAEVDAAVDSVLAELNLWNKTDYEKIKGAYDWVTENVQYDFDNEDNDEYELCHSTYAAAVQRIAVCQGYATLYYRMMLELGIDCR